MATALEILNDPNYINANDETKQAIFNLRIASLPEYQNANPQTQDQIRRRFQVTPTTAAEQYLGVSETAAPRAPATPAEQYLPRSRAVDMTPEQVQRERANPTPTVSREAAVLSGVERGLRGPAEFVDRLDPTSYLWNAGEDFFYPGVREQREAEIENFLAQQARTMQQQRPNSFGGGRIAGEVLGTAPLMAVGGGAITAGGARIAQNAPRLGALLQQFGTAAGSGGLATGRTAAQTAGTSGLSRLGQMGVRALGGGTAGAASAAVTDQDISTGFAAGAALPVLSSIVRRLLGGTVDLTRLPRLAAARVLREALENNVEQARALFAQLSPNDQRLSEQVLIEAGIEPRPFFGVGRVVQDKINPTEFAERLEGQAAAREAGLAEAAGGANMEQVRAAAREGRAAVTREMTPELLAAQKRAGYASQVVPGMQREAASAIAQADKLTRSGVVRRMRELEGRLDEQLDLMRQYPEFFPEADQAIQRTDYLSGAAGERANEGITRQLRLRDRARTIDDEINDMAAQGLQPIEAAPVIAAIRQTLRIPEVRVDDVRAGILQGIVDKLQLATDRNGMLDVSALGRIRQTSINDVVERITRQISAGGAPSSGASQRGASAALEMRDMIDNLIREGGGGQQYTDYLTRSQAGYASVNRGELAGEALRRYKEDPNAASAFLSLVRGDQPESVYSVMGGGPANESFSGVMSADPTRLAPIERAAGEMETLNRMRDLRSQGSGRANDILSAAQPGRVIRGLASVGLSPFPIARISLTGGGQVADQMQARMMRQTQQRLSDAYLNPPDMSRLLNTFSTSSRMADQLGRAPSAVISNAMLQGLQSSGVPEGGMLLGYGLTEDGQPYPIYDTPQLPAGSR